MIIYLRDCIQAGYCVQGVRDYCKARGINFKKLVRDGFCVEKSNVTVDGLMQKIIDMKNKQQTKEE